MHVKLIYSEIDHPKTIEVQEQVVDYDIIIHEDLFFVYDSKAGDPLFPVFRQSQALNTDK